MQRNCNKDEYYSYIETVNEHLVQFFLQIHYKDNTWQDSVLSTMKTDQSTFFLCDITTTINNKLYL